MKAPLARFMGIVQKAWPGYSGAKSGLKTVGDHQPDRVLGHRQRLALILAVGDDLGKRRNAHSEAALFLGFEHDGESSFSIHGADSQERTSI
jgi:hypothetical protein